MGARLLSVLLVAGVVIVSACAHDFDKYDFSEGGQGGVGLVPSVGGSGATTSSGGAGTGTGLQGGGGSGECVTNDDCGMDTACKQTVCTVDSVCVAFDADIGTSCMLPVGGGDGVCDGVGNCVACINGTQCPSGVCDTFFNECLDPTCMDGVTNGSETDVDCGGGTCPACMNDDDCAVAADCTSLFCDAGTCAACTQDADCAAVASHYCDAGICAPQKVGGTACAAATECISGFCPADDGVCCDVACEGLCESCLAADTAQGNDGVCDAVTAGTDPKGECAAVPSMCQSDFCSGTAGACQPAMAGTACRAAAGDCDLAETCDGASLSCPMDALVADGQPSSGGACDPYLCDGMMAGCPTSCAASGDCVSGFTCNVMVCE